MQFPEKLIRDHEIFQDKFERPTFICLSLLLQVPSASIDSISAIYAKPENVSANNSTVKTSSRPTSRMSTKSMKKSQEFKDLLREVDEKRLYRVGLNLFNSKPELGIEYLVQVWPLSQWFLFVFYLQKRIHY